MRRSSVNSLRSGTHSLQNSNVFVRAALPRESTAGSGDGLPKLGFLALGPISACVPVQPKNELSPKDNVIEMKRPSILSVDPTKDNQLRDGVRIIVTPTAFSAERRKTSEFRFQSAILMVGNGPAARRNRSEPTFGPDEVRFKIRISNRLPRVVRLAGTAVAFQPAGRTTNVPPERYAEFLNGIVLPQQEGSLDLVGPKVSDIKRSDLRGDSATLALLLCDVVTATDAAGTPTRSSNFEFFDRFAVVRARDSVVVKQCKLMVSMHAHNYSRAVAQKNSNQCARVPEWESAYEGS